MPSAQTHKMQANKKKSGSTKKARVPENKRQAPWSDLHAFLDEAEIKVKSFNEAIDKTTVKMEEKTLKSLDEFESYLHQAEDWFEEQASKLRSMESRAETVLDSTRVKVHLASMDAKDRISQVLERTSQIKGQIDKVWTKTGDEANSGLKKLRDTFVKISKSLDS